MAILVEDGSGVAGAEALCLVAFFKAHNKARGRDVDSLDSPAIEAALRNATDYMQATYAARWAGMRATDVQALDWPRAYVPRAQSLTGSPFYYATNVVPVEVQRACAELAWRAATTAGGLMPDVVGLPVKRVRADVIEKEYDTSRGTPAPRYSAIDAMLQPFFQASSVGGMIKLVRA